MSDQIEESVVVPSNLDEAGKLLSELREAKQQIGLIVEAMNTEVARLQQEADQAVKPYQQKIDECMSAIYAFANEQRASITDGGKTKTVSFASGKISWRTLPTTLEVTRDEDTVIAAIEGLNLDRFIKTKKLLNKRALLDDPVTAASIAGIQIITDRGESFQVTPLGYKPITFDYTSE